MIDQKYLNKDLENLDYEKYLNKDLEALSDKIIAALKHTTEHKEIGEIQAIHDGIVVVKGLTRVVLGELIEFDNGVQGIVYDLKKDTVKVVVFSDHHLLQYKMCAYRTGKSLSVPVGDSIIGRVINAFGKPIDDQTYSIETSISVDAMPKAPKMMERRAISEQLNTGTIAIDAAIPIGLGQRELIIGDSQSGKTSLAIGTIINQLHRYQSNDPIYCFYVAIGKKMDDIIDVYYNLKKTGAMEYTTIIAASASDSAHIQFITPYAACAMAEHFMRQGKNCLIIYDDLSKHIVAYREMSRLLGKPAGRDAFPAESFFMHAKLLEVAACLSKEHGGGSLTALPIIQTEQGDISDYISTNVISITDGQVYMRKKHMNSRINIELSVSRIGNAAQNDSMRKSSANIKSILSRYSDLLKTSAFSDPDELEQTTKDLLLYGDDLSKLLNQALYELYNIEEQVILLFAVKHGLLKSVDMSMASKRKYKFIEFVKSKHNKLIYNIKNSGTISELEIIKINHIVDEFIKNA